MVACIAVMVSLSANVELTKFAIVCCFLLKFLCVVGMETASEIGMLGFSEFAVGKCKVGFQLFPRFLKCWETLPDLANVSEHYTFLDDMESGASDLGCGERSADSCSMLNVVFNASKQHLDWDVTVIWCCHCILVVFEI